MYAKMCVFKHVAQQPLDDAQSVSFSHPSTCLLHTLRSSHSMCLRYLFLFSFAFIHSFIRSIAIESVRHCEQNAQFHCVAYLFAALSLRSIQAQTIFVGTNFLNIFNANEKRQPVIQSANVRVP